MRFLRERPRIAAILAFLHLPALTGLFVMAAERLGEKRGGLTA